VSARDNTPPLPPLPPLLPLLPPPTVYMYTFALSWSSIESVGQPGTAKCTDTTRVPTPSLRLRIGASFLVASLPQ